MTEFLFVYVQDSTEEKDRDACRKLDPAKAKHIRMFKIS